MSDRRRRRERVRDQRRVRQFVSILAEQGEKIDELKEQRPPDAAIQRVQTIPTDEVHATDDVSQETLSGSNVVFTWSNDPWGRREWGATNVE